MPACEVSTVMFDLGDTLFEPLNSSSIMENLEAVASTVKFDADPRELLTEFRRTRTRIEQELSDSNSTFYLHREFIGKVVSALFATFDCPIADELVEQFCDAQRDAVVANLRPRSDCAQTLENLRGFGYKLAIVSNIDDEWLEPISNKWNLERMVDKILSSEQARSCKPDSSIFLQACRMIDAPPHEVIFVGDSFVNDVEGSKTVGMKPVWFNPDAPTPDHDGSVRSIAELSKLVPILTKTETP